MHHQESDYVFYAGVITSSDKGFAGQREDTSGKVIIEILEAAGYIVKQYTLLPDEKNQLADEMKRMADELELDLILTTGGTGFSPRDVTPEATKAVIDKECPGICEAIRAYSMTITPNAMLSRSVSGIRGKTLIVNLPGNHKAVRESLEYILRPLQHGLGVLTGKDTECGPK